MKELSGTARNYAMVIDADNGKKELTVELILVLSEPQYRLAADGLVRERISESVRVSMCRKSLKSLLATIIEIDEEMEHVDKYIAPAKKAEPVPEPITNRSTLTGGPLETGGSAQQQKRNDSVNINGAENAVVTPAS